MSEETSRKASRVWLWCGDEQYRWPEAPPMFFTTRGRMTLRWQRNGLAYEDYLGTRVYRYSLVGAEATR